MSAAPVKDAFRFWARSTYAKYHSAVAHLGVRDAAGDEVSGTAFHVGDGVFVTARHVLDGTTLLTVGFDPPPIFSAWAENMTSVPRTHGTVNLVVSPRFHPDPRVDVACFRVTPFPPASIPLGGHFDDYLGPNELVLHRTLLMGYPPIPLSDRPNLVASLGEINALIDLYAGTPHPHFVISTMARGGFSGSPVLVAYNEDNQTAGTALLGLVTQSLTAAGAPVENGYLAAISVEAVYNCLKANDMLPPAQEISPDGE